MKSQLRSLAVLLLAVGAAACASDRPSTEATSSTTEPIVNGKPVNEHSDPISYRFPQSTVRVRSVTVGASCTGVVISDTKILTASHCSVDTNTLVYQYPVYQNTSVDGNAGQIPTPLTVASVLNATTCVPYSSGCKDSTGNFADLAILNLTSPLPQPHTSVIPGVINDYAYYKSALPPPDASPASGTLWAVGTGFHNGVDNSANWTMEWTPVTLSSTTDNGGSFRTEHVNTDDGDSGGPLFASLPNGDLILIGILSGTNGSSTQDGYTSVVSSSNWSWVENQIIPSTRDIEILAETPAPAPADAELLFNASGSQGDSADDDLVLLPRRL